MQKHEFIEKLNDRDLPGVGCVAVMADGNKDYFFYPDYSSANMGIDRASAYFRKAIDAGHIRRVDYIHKDFQTVHFWDWNEKSGNFCAADEFRSFNKSVGLDYFYDHSFRFISIINGRHYKYDYTPAIDGISAIVASHAN